MGEVKVLNVLRRIMEITESTVFSFREGRTEILRSTVSRITTIFYVMESELSRTAVLVVRVIAANAEERNCSGLTVSA